MIRFFFQKIFIWLQKDTFAVENFIQKQKTNFCKNIFLKTQKI